MKLREHIKWMLSENPIPPTKQLDMFDYGQNGNETVILTPLAPKELRDLAGESGEVILVSVNPYKVKLKDGSDEVFTVWPKDIVFEDKVTNKVQEYTKKYINFILNKK
jgi:hypothetical protein